MGICTGYKLACRLVITHPPKTMSPTTSDLKTKVQPTAVQELCAKKGGALREGGAYSGVGDMSRFYSNILKINYSTTLAC